MRKNTFTLAIFLTFFLSSCYQDSVPEQDLKDTSAYTSTRSSDPNYSRSWLENYRLNLLDSENNTSYSIADVCFGSEAIFNYLGCQGTSFIDNQIIETSTLYLPTTGGSMTLNNIRLLNNHIYNEAQNYIFSSTPGLVKINVDATEEGSTTKFDITLHAGNLTEPNYMVGSGMQCNTEAFAETDCFRSAEGDPDTGEDIIDGGPCPEPNDLTSAQEEVQDVISNDIPKDIYDNKGQIIGKYVFSDVEDRTFSLFTLSYYQFDYYCEELNLDFTDFVSVQEEIEYNSDELNCVVCGLKKLILDECPEGKRLCGINVESETLDFGGFQIVWLVDVEFCDAELIYLEDPTIGLGNNYPPVDSLIDRASFLNI